ncbi:MAG: BREX-1 system adenine-specific DNA-methyltransferase PglX [Candidatus Nitricoxidivorans perseverans]|uniref:BREX-1 system adenine-specific DNA-methyltransferase PglX n=1 Tax=Candidatus Nitricoxidivorans perseverans TaxID=2975601 RepID=A0AA49FLN8_9PROT|nr:MAG: BREX-1 system adenine-specific DNA-methyltransferase PglX [Candidatus Nitricoxidivorans perseverans]
MNEINNKQTGQGMQRHFFHASTADFNKVPGRAIVYWASDSILNIFDKNPSLSKQIETREGLTTGSNSLFLRLWHEVSLRKIGFQIQNNNQAHKSGCRYFPYVKGGDFRRWSGNFEYVVNWFNDGEELKAFKDPATGRVRSHNYNGDYAFKAGFTWSGISSGTFAVRNVPCGFMFDAKGPMGFSNEPERQGEHQAFLNSAVTNHLLMMLAPTLDFKLGHVLNLPTVKNIPCSIERIRNSAVQISLSDWNANETSWNFTELPVLHTNYRQPNLKTTYYKLRDSWRKITQEMQGLEEENNRIFIYAYGLRDELSSEVPLSEVTLNCNPHYRYGGDKNEEELEAQLLADTMRELVSYAVGCMFGRYALEKPGLILANQGETLADYLRQVPEPSFPADDDNVIPLLDDDWFTDDITLRFRQFLRIAFGDAHYEDNLTFIEQALNVKGKRNYGLRDYFLGEFYNDHVKRYKKRPIYWLFSSPKGSFNALIYLHRYRPDTASVVLQYLRDFRSKLVSERDHQEQMNISTSASQGEKTKALKRIEELKKILVELDDYERDTLYPLATRQVALDLDDGVKRNYVELGAALKKIPGLDAKDEE